MLFNVRIVMWNTLNYQKRGNVDGRVAEAWMIEECLNVKLEQLPIAVTKMETICKQKEDQLVDGSDDCYSYEVIITPVEET